MLRALANALCAFAEALRCVPGAFGQPAILLAKLMPHVLSRSRREQQGDAGADHRARHDSQHETRSRLILSIHGAILLGPPERPVTVEHSAVFVPSYA